MHEKKTRAARGCFLLEGLKNIQDALAAGYFPKAMLVCRKRGQEALVKVRAFSVPKESQMEVSSTQMKELCLTSTPQELAVVFRVPVINDKCNEGHESLSSWDLENKMLQSHDFSRWQWKRVGKLMDSYQPHMPFILVCDCVRDPANLGSMLRSAAAAGCQLVVCTRGCADVWLPKVVRTSGCAHLHIPVLNNVSWDFLEEICSKQRNVFLSHSTLTPMAPPGITLLPADQLQRMRHYLQRIPKRPHHAVGWSLGKHGGVLVVGDGGTAGLSINAVHFAARRPSQQVCVVSTEGVPGLSAAASSAVLLFSAMTAFDSASVDPETA